MSSTVDGGGTGGPAKPDAGAAPEAGDGGSSLTGVAEDTKIGEGAVGVFGILIVAVIVLAAMVAVSYCLIALWPPSNTSTGVATDHLFGIRISLDRDQQLFVIVGLAGILGGLIHSVRSLYWYVGNRVLRRSWLLMYVSLPIVGGALAVVFYLILRGGLLTGEATAQVNFFGFAAVSALVGLFSVEAAEKLRQIFSTVLAPALTGKDRLAGGPRAVAEGFEPQAGHAGTTITIRGQNLSATSAVLFHGGSATATVVSDTEVQGQIPLSASTGQIRLVVGDRIVGVPGIFTVESG
jgi:IPT/TIG domain